MEGPATVAPIVTGGSAGSRNLHAGSAARVGGGKTPVGGYRSGSTQPNEAVQHLQMQVKELSGHLEGLEKERDFYFEKVCSSVFFTFGWETDAREWVAS
jgi:microtubule-associated protein, RP/EB family